MNLSSFFQRLPAARILRKTKDSLVAVGAKDRFNQLIRPYGRVLEFQLNTQERTVYASFRLKGEIETIRFWVHEYKLVENKRGQPFIVVDGKDIETSVEWCALASGSLIERLCAFVWWCRSVYFALDFSSLAGRNCNLV
jgi:hypothetical protein